MAHKRALNAVDSTIEDLRGDSRRFGGDIKYLDCICERAILAAKNKDIYSLNFITQSQIYGEVHSYSVTVANETTNYSRMRRPTIRLISIPFK